MKTYAAVALASLVGLGFACDATPTSKTPDAVAGPAVRPFTPYTKGTGNPYWDRFLVQWNQIHDPKNGYFSPKGIPYHAVETLMCEAPDYGHETTSEAYSYYVWLEALYGRVTKDWSYLNDAWANLEAYMIPGASDQPTTEFYDPSKPAQFTPELDEPNQYPAALDPSVPVGADPLADELRKTYGDSNVYAMHWLLDVDNWYGFGRRNDGTSSPVFINTFQRGPQESVWEVIPQPSWDEMKYGGSHGYLDLFVAGSDAKQWRYSVAPDADARAIQAVYWAKRWADEQHEGASVGNVVAKAAKLGDYLRYSLFDKYFKPIGCGALSCPGGAGRASEHYLLAWYFAWGGGAEDQWAWRIGSSWIHQGYQNPMAAYALSSVADMRPRSPTAWGDWARSLSRQIELYRFLQSAEGGIAGGVTNSEHGRYAPIPPGTKAFYGMPYDPSPVFTDPPSNDWFGFQTWSMERVAEYYYVTADKRAEVVLSKWIAWVKKNSKLTADGYSIPSSLEWSGAPSASWDGKTQAFDPNDASYNAGLHVVVKSSGEDVGTGASVAKALSYWAARSGDKDAYVLARGILDRMWAKYRDDKGLTAPETREDYKRFADHVYVPNGWQGKMPNGDPIDQSSTFIGIRTKYKSDPDWPRVEKYLKGGPAPEFKYHRFWAQSEIATANAIFGTLFASVIGAKQP